MSSHDLHAALTGITTDDIHIDSLGRAVITHPDVVAKLSGAGVKVSPDLTHAAGNIICTGSMPANSRELLEAVRNVARPE